MMCVKKLWRKDGIKVRVVAWLRNKKSDDVLREFAATSWFYCTLSSMVKNKVL